MTPLFRRSAPGASDEPRPRRKRLRDAATGAAAGTLLWVGAILLGIPRLAGFEGHDFTVVSALLGALAALTPLRTALYVKTAVVALIVAVVAYTPVIERPVHALVRRDALLAGNPRPDAVVVLAEGITADSLLWPQALDRLLSGAEYVKTGVAPRLVITRNVERYRGRGIPSTPDQQRIVALAGIDPASVQVVDSVHSTRDEAVRAWQLLAPQGIRRIVLVTSPMHSGRACRTFQRVGFSVTCWPSVSRDVPFTRGALHRSMDRLRAFQQWLYERVAFQYYHLKGWI